MSKQRGRKPEGGYKPPPDAAVELKLLHPIEAYGGTVEVIGIRRPKGRDLRQLDGEKGDMGKALKLLELCASLPKSAVDNMDFDDVNRAQDVFDGFSTPSPEDSPSSGAEGSEDPDAAQ